jgi:hypothetical protein
LKEAVRIERERGLPVVAFPESFAHGGLFDRLQFLRGLENVLLDFVQEPAELQELIDRVLAYNLKYIDRWLENEIDVIWFHGDIGTQRGLMFFASPSSDVPLANIEAICDAWEEYGYFGYQQ